jgi:hypothetical protein
MLLSPSRSLAGNGVPKQELGNQEGWRRILPVRRTGWKPVPPMPLTGYNAWLPFFAFAFANG